MRLKKIVSLFLAILVIASLGSVFADDKCTGKDDCPSTDHNVGCPKYITVGVNDLGISEEFTSADSSDIGDMKNVGGYKINIAAISKNTDGGKNLINKYRIVISLLAGIGMLTMLLLFVINFAKLGKSAGNPQMRQTAITGILFTGIGTLLLGGVMTFFTFFYNFI